MSNVTKSEQKSVSTIEFLESLIKSNKLPGHIKKVEDAFTIAQMGKELGFSTMQSFHQIIPIQGKLSLSAKAIGALLRKGGVKFKTKEDALFLFSDGTTGPFPSRGTEDTKEKALDRRTTLLFIRDGMEEEVSFSWRDAELQGLTTKDNWKRMPREMLYARCLAKGANRIGQDLLLGLYMADELTDSFNVKESNIIRDDEGNVKEIIEDVPYTEETDQ